MTERQNGDGFFEVRADWYAQRARWLEKFLEEQTSMRTSPALRNSGSLLEKRKEAPIRPMPSLPLKKRIMNDRSVVTVTDGGWPSGRDQTNLSPTLSGMPIGDKEGTSLMTACPSPSPGPNSELDSVILN
jgi:hypothetical protein